MKHFLAYEVGIAVVFALMLCFQSATLHVVAASSAEPQKQGPAFLLFGNVTLGTTFLSQPRIVHLRVDIEGQRWSWSLEMNKTSSYAFKYGGFQSPSKRGTLTVRIPRGSQLTHVIRHTFPVMGVQRLDIDERDIDPEEEMPLSTISLPETSELVLLFDSPAPLPMCAGKELTESFWPMSTVYGAQCSVRSIVSSLKLTDDFTCEWREGSNIFYSLSKAAGGCLMCGYVLLGLTYMGVARAVQSKAHAPCSSDADIKWKAGAIQAWQDAQGRLLEAEMSQPACFYYLCTPLSNCTIELKGLWNRDPNGRLVRPP